MLPREVSQATIERFRQLGAVRVGIPTNDMYNQVTGIRQRMPYPHLIYFFDAQGREIGYWSELHRYFDDEPFVFAPNYRQWSQANIDNLNWERMPAPLEMDTITEVKHA